jgi:hypothetical protein
MGFTYVFDATTARRYSPGNMRNISRWRQRTSSVDRNSIPLIQL